VPRLFFIRRWPLTDGGVFDTQHGERRLSGPSQLNHALQKKRTHEAACMLRDYRSTCPQRSPPGRMVRRIWHIDTLSGCISICSELSKYSGVSMLS